MSRLKPIVTLGVALLTLAALVGLVWVNYSFTSRQKGGNDFAVYWTSERTLLFDGATPYGVLASLKSQNLIYGLGGREGDPPSRLDLPFHISTVMLPVSLISDFQLARAIWMTILEIALLVSVFFCLRTFQWAPNPVVGAEVIFFAVFSVYGLWALILGNSVILVGLLIASALLALQQNQDELTGILLALATFKFLSVGFFLVFILFWGVFQHRWRIFFPFLMTIVILTAISFFFSPNWLLPYFRAVYANIMFGDWLNPAKIFQESLPYVGKKLGWVLSGFLAVILLLEWWFARKKEFPQMVWAAALTIAITPLLGLPTYPQNYIILIIPLIYSLSIVASRWKNSTGVIISGILILLFIGLWLLALYAHNKSIALFFPLPLITIFLLYWIRWWTVKTPRITSDALMSSF